MKCEPKEISALTLLEKILEFGTKLPKGWPQKGPNDLSSSYFRMRQIEVLLKLFTPEIYNPNDLKSGMEKIINGDFIRIRKGEIYIAVFNQMDEIILNSIYKTVKRSEWSMHELMFNYSQLINFKIKLNQILEFNDGIMEISYPYFYSVILSKEIIENLQANKIDKFLSAVIDPKERTFTREDLIKNLNYPKEDVYEIDLDNW